MYSILHETDDPTAVNLSAFGNFLPGTSKQLVTIGSKCLKLYRLNPYCPISLSGDADAAYWTHQTTQLECLLNFTLMAPPRALGVAKVPAYPECDSLLLTFEDAKLSIVNIDPSTMGLNTLSLHCIEDEILRDGYTNDTHYPELAVDPDGRCCAFLVFGRHIAIVSFSNRIRSHHLESYSLALRKFDERLDNIYDMSFLSGYYEPTLLFLYQPIQTTAGRASIRYDTVSVLGVSLNVKERTYAVVWNFGGLPMTIDRCLAMPLPIGGVCLIGLNEIIYLNQSAPPCGISTNSNGEDFTKFPLANFANLHITLDGSVCQAISQSEVFIVLRTGFLYGLELDIDASNSVRGLSLKRIYETVSPYTLSCIPDYLFIGSRLGDSVLLHYSCESKKTSANCTNHEPQTKKIQLDANISSADDDFLYGFGELPAAKETTEPCYQASNEYKIRLIDNLSNIGPCRDMKCCISMPKTSDLFAAYNIEEMLQKRDAFFDIVTASGHGKDSSLCFFERTIRPDIFTTSPLNHAQQFWTIGRHEDDAHKYLVIAKERNTLVLELGSDMAEIDHPIFNFDETTIAAGELASGSISVQVTPTHIVIVADDQRLETVTVDSNFPVTIAAITDPYIVLLTQNGKILLYKLVSLPHIHLRQIQIFDKLKHDKSPITSVSLYKDLSGMVAPCSHQTEHFNGLGNSSGFNVSEEALTFVKKEGQKPDDIDVLLYGANEDGQTMVIPTEKMAFKRKLFDTEDDLDTDMPDKSLTAIRNPNHVVPTYWLFFARENGNLYIYSIPEFQLVYMVKKFNQLHEVLYDDASSAFDDDERYMNIPMVAIAQTSDSKSSDSIMIKPEEVIMELLVAGLGINQARPVLSALVDDTVVFYEMFAFDNGIGGHIAVRFRRLHKNVVIRNQYFLGPNGRAPVETSVESDRHYQYIHFFDRIGNLSNGIFVTGGYPSAFFIGKNGTHLHPMICDGPIDSFASFNNINCPYGFLYLTRESNMRIAMLQASINYDASYPFRKIPVGNTIHFIAYLLQKDVLAIIISEQKPNNKMCTVVNEDKQIETFERDANFVLPMLDFYSMKLFSTEDWCFVPTIQERYEEFETITCCEEVVLQSEGTTSGFQNYLAMGTSMNFGEEVFVRGRIIVYELAEVIPEEGKPTTRHRFKKLYDKEQKGPVTSICACNGFLLTGMGQKVFIWQFRDNQLLGVSFLDLHFYIHRLIGFRNLALACDLYRSLSLIRYQEEFKALSLVSRDTRPMAPQPLTAQFIVDQKQLAFLLTDELGNLLIFNYSPETKESIGGERLIIRSGINIGSLVNTTVRVKGHGSECLIDNKKAVEFSQSCMFATLDGSMGVVRPLSEKVFRRLHMLQQVMTTQVSQPAGLNPRGSRAIKPQKTGTNQQLSSAKNIVDGLLIFQYLYLSTPEKIDLARRLGSSRYQIIDDLTELSRIITHY